MWMKQFEFSDGEMLYSILEYCRNNQSYNNYKIVCIREFLERLFFFVYFWTKYKSTRHVGHSHWGVLYSQRPERESDTGADTNWIEITIHATILKKANLQRSDYWTVFKRGKMESFLALKANPELWQLWILELRSFKVFFNKNILWCVSSTVL